MDKLDAKATKGTRDNSEDNTSGFSHTLKQIWDKIAHFLQVVWSSLKHLWHSFLRAFAKWSDPKLEPYRTKEPTPHPEKRTLHSDEGKAEKVAKPRAVVSPQPAMIETFIPASPKTREDLFALLREAPMSVLTSNERKAMSAVLNLSDIRVSELMSPATKIVFVDQDETLGPLVLDRLYRSGFTYFPVVDGRQHIIGILPTALLNSLDIKETNTAKEIMDPRVYYIRRDYTIEQALKAFLRTDSQLMLVIDRYEKLAGMLTFAQIMDYLFGEKFDDAFDRDNDRLAVAKRK